MLVSNIGQSGSAASALNDVFYLGQAFSVGADGSNYTLTSIEIPFRNAGIAAVDIGSLSVSVWSTGSSGFPSALLHTLMNPASITAGTTVTFNAQAGATFEAGTTYAVVVYFDKDLLSQDPGWSLGGSGEDADPAMGWEIADSRMSRRASGTTWSNSSSSSVHKIRVNGTAAGGGTPNTAPAFADATATRDVPENSAPSTDVGDPIPEASDADSDTLTYFMDGTDEAHFSFNDFRQILTFEDLDYETKNTYSVTVTAADGNGGTDTIAVTINVTDVNEKSAKPDKPLLAAVPGSSTTLTARWTKPDLNGGPDITGYKLEYRAAPAGTWMDVAHTGTAVTTTITGLTADTSYQVRVRAVNGETDSDWSDPSDAVSTNAADMSIPPGLEVTLHLSDVAVLEDATPVTVTATVTPATPVAFTVEISASPVAPVTGDDFDLSTNRTLSFAANATESTGTVTISPVSDDDPEPDVVVRVSGAVSNAAIMDPDGVTLTIRDDDAELPVDDAEAAPTVASVVIANDPQSGNTYHWGETIVFTVTFSEPVRVTGRPGLEVGLDNPAGVSGTTVQARFWGLSESQRLTAGTPPVPVSRHVHFAYTVQPFDRDTDGVRIGADALRLAAGDRIRSEKTGANAEFDHAALGPQSGHRVDGRTTADGEPAVPVEGAGIAFVDGNGDPLETRADGNHRLSVPEGGEARYGLRLNTRPAHRVVVSYHYTNEGDADLAVPRNFSTERSIAPDEWDAKTVWLRVEAAQDADAADGERVFAHNTASNDPNYHHLVLPDVIGVEDDDDEAGPLALSVFDAQATEGVDDTLDFTVRLHGAAASEVTVDYRTEDGTATAGSDYTARSGTLTFAPDDTERTVSVPIIDDEEEDDGETFTLVLSNASFARDQETTATGTIRNTEATARTGLTAAFEGVPEAHDGQTAFTLRMAFSEPLSWMNGRRLREDVVAVAGGRATSASRVDRRRDLWQVTVEPDSLADVTVTLAAGAACDTPAAVCTKDGRALSTTIATTVAGPPAAPLTASFEGVPSEHDGQTVFTLRMAFSEPLSWMNGRRLRSEVVALSGGRATSASRVDRRRDLWKLTVEPDSSAAVTVTLAAGAACRTPAAVCTKDGRALSTTIATTVRGPVAVSVADARAEEGTDATLDFAVTLSRAASVPVAVAYTTADGTATAGADYTARKGQLTFAPGETAKTVRVPVLDDAHDEGAETLSLRLSAASGALIADGVATGTIENSGPLQQAWLARFGRTAATHVTDAVSDRLRGTPGQDSHVTVGGYRLPVGKRDAAGKPEAGARESALLQGVAGLLGLGSGQAGGIGAEPGGGLGWDAWPDAGRDPRLGQSQSVNLNLRRLLLGSSFRLSLGAAATGSAGPRLTAWGRVAGTTFDGRDGIDGRDGTLSLNGDVLTGTVGVDGEWDRLLAGLAVAHSRGDGSYTMPVAGGDDSGNLEQTLTSIHPYLRYAVNDRLDVWGLFGYGWGELDLEMDDGMTIETDTNLVMGAFGGRGILLSAAESGGFQLATRTDAMLTRTTSDKVAEMESAEADAHRLRLVLEGSRGFTWAEGRRLTPTMEVGLRHDWGDAETGFGLELGGRVQYADPALGLTIEAAVRGLLAHEDSDYEEWGASGSLRLDPGAMGQGLALTLAPAWGATASGVDGLWSRQTTAGLAPQGNRAAPVGRLNAEVGYGFAPFDTGLLTPYAGTVLSDGADRTYRVGGRLQMSGRGTTGLTLSLEGRRQEPAGQQPVNQGLQFQITWGF